MGESSDSRSKIEMKLHFSRDKLCMIIWWILSDLLPPDLLMAVLTYTCKFTVLEGAVKIRDLPTIGGIREYILPKLFFKSSSFKSMIKFHNETGRRPTYTAWNGKKLPVTEPLLLMKKTRDWCEAHNSRSCQSCRPEAPSWSVFDGWSVPQEVSWKSYPKAV